MRIGVLAVHEINASSNFYSVFFFQPQFRALARNLHFQANSKCAMFLRSLKETLILISLNRIEAAIRIWGRVLKWVWLLWPFGQLCDCRVDEMNDLNYIVHFAIKRKMPLHVPLFSDQVKKKNSVYVQFRDWIRTSCTKNHTHKHSPLSSMQQQEINFLNHHEIGYSWICESILAIIN